MFRNGRIHPDKFQITVCSRLRNGVNQSVLKRHHIPLHHQPECSFKLRNLLHQSLFGFRIQHINFGVFQGFYNNDELKKDWIRKQSKGSKQKKVVNRYEIKLD